MSNLDQPPPARTPRATHERIDNRRSVSRKPLPRSMMWRYIAIAGGVVAVVIIAIVTVVLYRANQTLKTIEQEDPRRRQTAAPAPTSAPVAGGQQAQQPTAESARAAEQPAPTSAPPNTLTTPFNILLIGVDKRPNETDGARTDTMIMVHVDPVQKWASMLSIPRDSVAQIPRVGQAKINAAYTFGYKNPEELYGKGTSPDAAGGALAAETVEKFLGVRVDYVAQVDFRGFEQLVNAIGGVTVDVPRPLLDAEYPTDNYGVERIYIPAGLQVLDGRMALIYARSRHNSSDFDRSQRQQQVLQALLTQVKGRGLLENAALLPQWANVIADNARTTLPVHDLGVLNGLATLARELDSSRIKQASINPDTVRVDGENGSDIYWNKADIKALVGQWLTSPQGATTVADTGGVTGLPQTAVVQVLNATGRPGLGEQVSAQLQSQGFSMIPPAEWGRVYQNTTVIDYSGKPAARQQIAKNLNVAAGYVQATPGPDAPAQDGSADVIVILGQDYKGR